MWLVVLRVEDVRNRFVVDVAAVLGEERDERAPFTEEDPIRLLVLANACVGLRNHAPADHVREAPAVLAVACVEAGAPIRLLLPAEPGQAHWDPDLGEVGGGARRERSEPARSVHGLSVGRETGTPSRARDPRP